MDGAEAVMLYGGKAKECSSGPPIGLMDIGESETHYLFRVSMAGLHKNECEVNIGIEKEGDVEIRGKIVEERKGGYRVKLQQLCLGGPFKIRFQLPGPVDPRLYTPMFRGDGILEVIVKKRALPADTPPAL